MILSQNIKRMREYTLHIVNLHLVDSTGKDWTVANMAGDYKSAVQGADDQVVQIEEQTGQVVIKGGSSREEAYPKHNIDIPGLM